MKTVVQPVSKIDKDNGFDWQRVSADMGVIELFKHLIVAESICPRDLKVITRCLEQKLSQRLDSSPHKITSAAITLVFITT